MKNYNQFLFEKIINTENLLGSVDAKKVSGEIFGIDTKDHQYIEDMYDDKKFNDKLKEYRKGYLESTKEYETFLKNSLNVRYFLIFKNDQSELERPKYIFIQVRENGKWKPIELYKVKSDMKNFYDLLTNKKIEIKLDNKNYIYTTTNGGNDWTLQNLQNQDTTFKKIMRGEEINKILKTPNITIEEIE